MGIAKSGNELISNVNHDLENIQRWCNTNFITLNIAKSKAVNFTNMRENVLNIGYDGIPLQFVSYLKTLGFFIDKDLSFSQHITFMIYRVIITLRRLYSVPCNLSINVKKRIGHVLLMPLITYGLEVYSGITAANFLRVERCFNRVIRYVYGLRVFDHVSAYVFDFLGCSFRDFVNHKLLLLFYKMFKNSSPSFLVSRFTFSQSTRTHCLLCPRFHTMVMQRSFIVRVTRLWNSILPYENRNFSYTFKQFKRILLWLLSQ